MSIRSGAFALATLAALACAGPASAQQATVVELKIRSHRFEPPQVKVPKDKAFVLKVVNLDPTPEEFESKPLRLEKIIPGGGTAIFRMRPLKAGSYTFFGEFNEKTAQGVLIAE